MNFWITKRNFYPSLFRMLLGILLLVDAIISLWVGDFMFDEKYNMFYSNNIVFDLFRDHRVILYIVYILFLLSFLLGIGGFLVKAVVLLLSVIFEMLEPAALTWGDMILSYTLLFFIFVDSSRYFTIKTIGKRAELFQYLSQLAVWSIILNIFLVYLSNGYSKINDTAWQNGYAVYFSFAQFQDFENGIFYQILKHEWLTKLTNYFIIFFQITFPFFIMIKKTRFFVILIGVLLHLVMMWQFGLWKFELVVILLYGFLLSDDEWMRLLPNKFRHKVLNENF